MIGLGFGFGFDILGSNVNQLEAETLAYIDGLATPLSTDQISRINTLVKALKTVLSVANLSEALDYLYIDANETAEAAVKNIVQNLYHCTLVNSPAWAQWEGFTGNGTDRYIKTGFKLLTNAVRYSRDSASSGVYLRKNLNELRAISGATNAATTGSLFALRLSTNTTYSMVNNAAGLDATTGIIDTRGMWIQNRVVSTGHKLWQNKNVVLDKTVNSAALVDIEDYWLCYNENGIPQLYSNQQVAIRFKGRGLTDSEITGITDAFEVYMTSVGKSVFYASKPIAVFSFDDGYWDWVDILKPVFDTHGKKCTFNLITGMPAYLVSIGQYPANKISDAYVQTLIDNGFDLQCHTHDHINLTTLTEAQILEQYDAVNAYFSARGWPVPKHTVYPGGSNNAAVIAATQQRRLTAGTASGALFTETVNKYLITSFVLSINKNDAAALATFKTQMDSAVSQKKMMVFTGHRVYNDADADCFPGNSTQISYINDLLAYAISIGMAVKTKSELYNIIKSLEVTT